MFVKVASVWNEDSRLKAESLYKLADEWDPKPELMVRQIDVYIAMEALRLSRMEVAWLRAELAKAKEDPRDAGKS